MRFRFSLGCRVKGNVSISSSSGMRARLRRRRRALSLLRRYSASRTCFSNRSCEKFPRRAVASNSSHWANKPPRRSSRRILRSCSSILVLTFRWVGVVLIECPVVIRGEVRLIRQAAFLVGRALAIALIHLDVRQGMLSLTQAKPGDALERLPMYHAITPGPFHRLEEHAGRYVATENPQRAHETMTLQAGSFERVIQIGSDFSAQGPQPLLLLLGTVPAALGHLPRSRLPLRAEAPVLDALRRQRILGHADPLLIDLQAIRVLQQLDRFPPAARDPVVVPLEGCIAILIRLAFMRTVGGRKMGGQLDQVASFILERLGGNQAG